MDRQLLSHYVRQALAHLYDQAYLRRHPLVAIVAPGTDPESGERLLHRALIEAIDSLRPPPHVPTGTAPWRPYLVLSYYYVEGMERSQAARRVGISARQFNREQTKGVEAVIDFLRAKNEAAALSASTDTPLDIALLKLGTAPCAAAIALDQTLRGVVATVAQLAGHRGIAISTSLPPELPPVLTDRVVLRQVLLNSLSHAIEKGRGGRIIVTGRMAADSVHLAAEYSGEMVALGDVVGSQAGNRLTLASRLLEAQGGHLTVEEQENCLTVHLSLPIQRTATVLVIDDNPDEINLLRRCLAGGAYQVVAATTSQEALQLAQDLHPQAITLDVMMPNQDGWEVLQMLKNTPGTMDIPVIVCSVLREPDLALCLGASDLLVKPVARPALLQALARCLSDPAGGAARGQP